ncbi:MAG: hypothetical protein II886_13640 [Prevotella sp.]|nr:hypothetical protein [Prevotella sp.]
MAEKQELDVRAYYRTLSRTERGQLQRYMLIRYDYNPRTLSNKLNNDDSHLRRDERENIARVFKSGEWRNA